jgi:inorganic pyrophosphatase
MKRTEDEKVFIKDFLSWNMSDIEDLSDFNRYFDSLIDRYRQKKEIFF